MWNSFGKGSYDILSQLIWLFLFSMNLLDVRSSLPALFLIFFYLLTNSRGVLLRLSFPWSVIKMFLCVSFFPRVSMCFFQLFVLGWVLSLFNLLFLETSKFFIFLFSITLAICLISVHLWSVCWSTEVKSSFSWSINIGIKVSIIYTVSAKTRRNKYNTTAAMVAWNVHLDKK